MPVQDEEPALSHFHGGGRFCDCGFGKAVRIRDRGSHNEVAKRVCKP